MLVKNWMTTDVITLTSDRSMMKAAKIMKDANISRIPIVDDEGKIVGIISDRDVKEASPSKATTLDMHELYYLLSEIKIKDIMTRKPMTLSVEDTVEKAAVLMEERGFGGMPVVDEVGKVVGIITDSDIFRCFMNVTGVQEGGVQIGMRLSNQPGGLNPVLEFLREHNARLMSILTSVEGPEKPTRDVFIRIREMDKPELKRLIAGLEEQFEVLFWTRDSVHPVV